MEQELEMPTIMPINLHVSVGKMLRLSVIGVLLGGSASGQEVQSQAEKLTTGADKANVPDAIAKVKSGDFGAVHVDMIARAGAVDAIPSLKTTVCAY